MAAPPAILPELDSLERHGHIDTLTVAALIELGALSREDFDSALQQILRVDAGVMRVDRVSFWSFRSEPAGIFCELGFHTDERAYERGATVSEGECPPYFAELRNGNIMASENVLGDARLSGLGDFFAARRIASLLDVPIWVHSELAGVLCHEHGNARHWNDEELEFALAVSHSLSAALEARQRSGAEAVAKEHEFLSQASVRLARSLDPGEIAKRALELVVPQLADWAVLDVVDGDGLRRLGMAHKDPEKLAILRQASRLYPPAHGRPHLSSIVIRLGQSILHPIVASAQLSRYAVNPAHEGMIRLLGFGSALGVPLIVGGRVIGTLALSSTARTYDQDDLHLVEGLAERVASAFGNAGLYEQARKAIAVRDEFLSLASHELRTPLTSIQLAVDRLTDRPDSSGVPDPIALAILGRQVKRLGRLVEQLLDASQIGRGELSIKPERMDLVALVRDVTEELALALEQAGIRLTLELGEPVVGCWDPIKLTRLLSNLIDNAIKFAKGRSLEISVSEKGESALLVVRDHGPGIAPELVGRIFDRYVRGASAEYLGGLGLGLYIVHAIVDAHRGSVSLENAPGGGTRVTIELPRSRDRKP